MPNSGLLALSPAPALHRAHPQAPDLPDAWYDVRAGRPFTITDFARYCTHLGIKIDQQVYLSNGKLINVRRYKETCAPRLPSRPAAHGSTRDAAVNIARLAGHARRPAARRRQHRSALSVVDQRRNRLHHALHQRHVITHVVHHHSHAQGCDRLPPTRAEAPVPISTIAR